MPLPAAGRQLPPLLLGSCHLPAGGRAQLYGEERWKRRRCRPRVLCVPRPHTPSRPACCPQHSALADIIGAYPLRSGLSDEEVARERRLRECFTDFLLGEWTCFCFNLLWLLFWLAFWLVGPRPGLKLAAPTACSRRRLLGPLCRRALHQPDAPGA